ncbi:hypothetical protein PAAG_00166 [Paracoccidioides lutzii Pb01]|uniref:Myb-like domain-containing protein n=1 Tax=Paracoccidioides lutzii (strain ATCC MYA-826 / Pb01) TaxID=502779 RepID=C1GNS1_PARBA|nr:hypothetical protein PAAG_00166 [Paracoccidioides lutzii Pb01]EEH35843.1 hypothetical protein PAAG_00166 [Paracoccidioides lutzii Pb01]
MGSSTSVYDPDEEDDSSDNDYFEHEISPTGFTASFPPLQKLNLASSPGLKSPPKTHSNRPSTNRLQSRANGLQPNRKLHTEKYAKLFNEVVNGTFDGSAEANKPVCAPSQIGVVTWSSQEKETLFNALEKKGKNGIREIASHFESKTVMEIQAYLETLHEALERQQLMERFSKNHILSDVPAAAEISEECCQALEENALALSRLDEKGENTVGRQKYGDMWLVDRHVAALVEDRLDEERDGSGNDDDDLANTLHPPPSILATAHLLNVGNWILLSERIFMNSGKSHIEDNWYNLRVDKETPSLTCEAFADFYALAISITRRLIQSAIFFSMSRIRALERGGYQRGKLVRRADVGAALDVLKMSHNSRQFWMGAARRHNLNVEDIRHRKGFKPTPLTYDEVEEELSLEAPRSRTSRSNSVAQSVAVSENNSISDAGGLSDDASSASAASTHHSSNISTSGDEEHLSDPEEVHAAALDKKYSRGEELRLLREISLSPPRSLFPEHEDYDIGMEKDAKSTPPRPSGTRKRKQDLIDWRDRVLYRSEWEEYGPDIAFVDDELSENRKKKRRIG